MPNFIKSFFRSLFGDFFRDREDFKLGLYGPPNSGKSTLANTISQDWLGEEMSSVSEVPHETREVTLRDEVTIENDEGKTLSFSLVDTPGIATQIDYEDFLDEGLEEEESKERSKEATKGVIEAIEWLEDMDAVVVVLDSTKNPYSQVNVTIVGNLEARDIPVLVLANKIDLEDSDPDRVRDAFPQYEVLPISAKEKENIEEFYDKLFEISK